MKLGLFCPSKLNVTDILSDGSEMVLCVIVWTSN